MRESKLKGTIFVKINANNFDKVVRQMGFGAFEDNSNVNPTKDFEKATGHSANKLFGLLAAINKEPEFTNDPRDIKEFKKIWKGFEKSGKYMTMEEAESNFRGKALFLMEDRVYETDILEYMEEMFDM